MSEYGHAEPKRGTEWWGMYGTTTWVTKKYLYIGNTFIDTYPFFASLA